MNYIYEAPELVSRFLTYHETIRGHSRKTVDEYYLDLRLFFRFIKQRRDLVPDGVEFDDIEISDIDLEIIKSISLSDVYAFINYLARDREIVDRDGIHRGLNASSRARKIATIRSFFKYLTQKLHVLDENPVAELDSPKQLKSLPRYLSLEESKALLSAVEGPNRERDYCILTLFLNCGLRISEMIGLNLTDISADHVRVLGKGGKQRIIYLNDACVEAINGYLPVRKTISSRERDALFVSRNRNRISRSAVHALVKKYFLPAGIDPSQYSAHKLRHTAATLMLHNGVDVRTLQELLGHEHLNTTQIYTHVDNEQMRIAASANPLGKFKPEKK